MYSTIRNQPLAPAKPLPQALKTGELGSMESSRTEPTLLPATPYQPQRWAEGGRSSPSLAATSKPQEGIPLAESSLPKPLDAHLLIDRYFFVCFFLLLFFCVCVFFFSLLVCKGFSKALSS